MPKSLMLLSMTILLVGCTSFRTTALHRHENDSVSKEKTNRCLKGLPTKLKVPSHVHVFVYEEQVIVDTGSKPVLVSFNPPQYNVSAEIEYTDKIFLVDIKRPAAGILDLKGASFDDEQYFAQVQADIKNETLKDITYALDKVKGPLSSLKPQSGSATVSKSKDTPPEPKKNVSFQQSIVAMQRFDISEPGWEERMLGFVNERLGVGLPPGHFGPRLIQEPVAQQAYAQEAYAQPVYMSEQQ